MRSRRSIGTLAVVLAAVTVLVAGCASQGPARQPAPSAAPAPSVSATVDPIAARARSDLDAMTLEQRLASMLMLHTPGTDPAVLRSFVDTIQPGGFILMGDNMPGLAALPQVTDSISPDASLPLLIGIDEEGGEVQRIDEDAFAGADTLKSLPPAETRAAFSGRAAMLRAAGCSVNFGIVADETADPDSFIFGRALGTTPEDASARVAQAVLGEHGTVLSTLKHFPGHGAAPGDSHSSLPSTPMSAEEWASSAALPFQAGIDAGAEFVMFGHLAYTSVDSAPASLSAIWHRMLRDQLGFDGVSITDDMLMLQHSGIAEFQNPSENAIRAVLAGNTMLLYDLAGDPAVSGVDPTVLVSDLAHAVRSGRIPAQLVDDAALKLLTLRIEIGAARG